MAKLNQTRGVAIYIKTGTTYTLPVKFLDSNGAPADKSTYTASAKYWLDRDMSQLSTALTVDSTNDATGIYIIEFADTLVTDTYYGRFEMTDAGGDSIVSFEFVAYVSHTHGENAINDLKSNDQNIVIKSVDESVIINHTGAVISSGGGGGSGALAGTWDASSGSFPGGGSAANGDEYRVTVAGTMNGVRFNVDDIIKATIDNPSTTTYAGNWLAIISSGLAQGFDLDLTLETNPNRAADPMIFYDVSAGLFKLIYPVDITAKMPTNEITDPDLTAGNYDITIDDRGHHLLVNCSTLCTIRVDLFSNVAIPNNTQIFVTDLTGNGVQFGKVNTPITFTYNTTLYSLESAGQLTPPIMMTWYDTDEILFQGGLAAA